MYEKIQTKENYDKLLASGMFWEFHPELSGSWEIDREVILLEVSEKPVKMHNEYAYVKQNLEKFFGEKYDHVKHESIIIFALLARQDFVQFKIHTSMVKNCTSKEFMNSIADEKTS